MTPKRVYLVRHGLTFCNEQGTVQTADDELSPKGLEQAAMLAERFSKIPFDTIVASDMRRAQKTAQTIAQKTGHAEPRYSELLREVVYPSSLFGLSRDSAEVQAYFAAKEETLDDPNWQYGDEQSFVQLKQRMDSALEWLLEQEGTVVAVSHGHFMRMLTLDILFNGALTHRAANAALQRLRTSNTGITVVDYDEGVWKLLTWNDHAHLG